MEEEIYRCGRRQSQAAKDTVGGESEAEAFASLSKPGQPSAPGRVRKKLKPAKFREYGQWLEVCYGVGSVRSAGCFSTPVRSTSIKSEEMSRRS